MHPSTRKRLRKNKAKSWSDNLKSSSDELLHSSASESKENVLTDAEEETDGETKTKRMVNKMLARKVEIGLADISSSMADTYPRGGYLPG